jgi:hypothetical protein
MAKEKLKDATQKDKILLGLAATIGLFGNLTANFIWETLPYAKLKWIIGIMSMVVFITCGLILSKGYGKIMGN